MRMTRRIVDQSNASNLGVHRTDADPEAELATGQVAFAAFRQELAGAAPGPSIPEYEPVRIPPAILEAQAAFERDLPRLLKERPGQWVAYRPEGPILFAADKTTLCQECERLGYREFLTRMVYPYPE